MRPLMYGPRKPPWTNKCPVLLSVFTINDHPLTFILYLNSMVSPSHTLSWHPRVTTNHQQLYHSTFVYTSSSTIVMPPQKSSPRPKKANNLAKPKGAVRAKSGCYTCRIRRKVCRWRPTPDLVLIYGAYLNRNVTRNVLGTKVPVKLAFGLSSNA